ncbi:MAG: acyl-CoA dehydrogenase family protein [Halobacteriaceae archaeon]
MLDYLDCDDDLTDAERGLRDEARAFVDDIRADLGDWFLDGHFPLDRVPEMGARGLFGPTVPGPDHDPLGPRAAGLAMLELEAGDSGLRSMASVQGALVMHPIARYGSDAQRERWLPRLRAGEAVGCYALTEPDHGSNPAGMETTARREGDRYVIDGRKRWSTNAPVADVAVVWARDRSLDGDPVRGFLVETDRDGVEPFRIDEKLSLRLSVSGGLDFDGASVPADAVLPGTDGLGAALDCLTRARYGIAWGTAGVARDCFEAARDHVTEREQFGRAIGGFQLVQAKLADVATGATTARLVARRLAALRARGDRRHQQVSLGKRHGARVARSAARDARELLGGDGVLAHRSPMRHLCNMETVVTYEGTDQIHTLVLGEDLTGLSAFQ